MNRVHLACWIGVVLVSGVACSDDTSAVEWVPTGERAAFPAALAVADAAAINLDRKYLYWVTRDGFLYRAPRAAGAVERVLLPAPGELLGTHDDVYVGWTDDSGNAAIADVDPATGRIKTLNHQAGALRRLVGGYHGYAFATTTKDGTLVQTCFEGVCLQHSNIASEFKSLALDFTRKTFHVLTADGLRTCTVSDGCPAEAAATPPATSLIAALPGAYFLLDSNGQASAMDGTTSLGSAAAADPTKFSADDGNGPTESPVGTWSNGSELAQGLLAPAATTTEIAVACTDFEVDATGRPIYCLVGSSSIQIIP